MFSSVVIFLMKWTVSWSVTDSCGGNERLCVCEDLFFAERNSLFSVQLLDPPLRTEVRPCPSPELEMALLAAGRVEAVELI